MAGSPQFKVYNPSNEYVAACKHAEDAAAVVAGYGPGARINHAALGLSKRAAIYVDGQDDVKAEDSVDAVASHCHDVLKAKGVFA